MPQWRDFTDFVGNIRFHTRFTDKKVKFGRFDYTQKTEYWALVWGTIIMAATGFVLWFPAMAVKILPSMAITASQTIHYYEAWLAMLAVVVWHFFFVFLHPDAYPMSWTWLTGKMSMEAVRKHHERWYEEEIADDRD
jgi:cytochrome b subunit of formate dehydrogenase